LYSEERELKLELSLLGLEELKDEEDDLLLFLLLAFKIFFIL